MDEGDRRYGAEREEEDDKGGDGGKDMQRGRRERTKQDGEVKVENGMD